jgi:MFS family permease
MAGYSWYVVAVLTFVYIFSFIDRQILTMLVRPIRRDLGISDTQMSLLMGFSFALFYTLFGMILGRLADTRSRRGMIAIGLAAWSTFTAGCGLARNFTQMFLLRMGVGVGEASLSPAAYSLIADYMPREQLATAISFYSMGIYVGTGLSYLLGGMVIGMASKQELWNLPLVGPTRPWQIIFFAVGLPGLMASLLLFTVREPVRKLIRGTTEVPLGEVLLYIRRNAGTFLFHSVGFGFVSLASYASGAWIPEFLGRLHHWTPSKIGLIQGTIVAIFGSLGILTSGRLADWIRARGTREANMKLGIWLALIWIPFQFLLLLASNDTWTIVWLVPTSILAAAPFGIAAAAIQQMMPAPMRGQASALYLFILNLIGLGGGPTAVAMVNQYVFRRDDALNYSLLIVNVAALALGAMLLWLGLKPFLRSLDRLRDWTAANV